MLTDEKRIIQIPINSEEVEGILTIPKKHNDSLIVFVHGSGSSRKSPRNNFVSRELNKAGFVTLLFDLLTEEEDQDYERRFDIPLLVERIKTATKWINNQSEFQNFNMGYFGSSTGAAAAIEAALDPDLNIKAIVSRGGRPDLAGDSLSKITTPVLLIVGENDKIVVELNQTSLEKIPAQKKLEIIPKATHLFEEPGALEQVSDLAIQWFNNYLSTQERR